ncbi:unnamed protein product [Amaranthus hypochondriacus]
MASSSSSTTILLFLAIFLIFLTKPNAGQLLPPLPFGVNINTIVVNGTLTCSPTLVGPGAPLPNTTITLIGNGTPLVSAITDANGNVGASIPISSLPTNLVGGVLNNGLSASVTAPISGCGLTTSVTPGTVLPLPLILMSITGPILTSRIGGLVNPLLPAA